MRTPRRSPQSTSFREGLQAFLTPAVWKGARQAWRSKHAASRWDLHALVGVLLVMTWVVGDSESERFETARAFYVACHPKGKRPGQTLPGFHKALARLPAAVLRRLAAGVRHQVARALLPALRTGGFAVLAVDGSRLECPRSAPLEQRLGKAGKEGSAPMLWLTALVLLPAGLLWSWRLGPGTANERQHARHLLPTLPARALLVADAGYLSFELFGAVVAAGASFLVRMSSKAYLYTEGQARLRRYREGLVYYWPEDARKAHQPPLRARLLRLRGKKGDVWLLTNVLEPARLTVARAGIIYRWRWGIEGLFRTYKRTLAKVKLTCRTVRLVHREAEGSLLALQLLLAQAAERRRHGPHEVVVVLRSPREELLRIRGQITTTLGSGLGPRQREVYRQRLRQARCVARERTSSKVRRPWPRRVEHKPPKPPQMRPLSAAMKVLMAETLQTAVDRKS
jgi:hypothetical protein